MSISAFLRDLLGFLVTGNGVGATPQHARSVVLADGVVGEFNTSTRTLRITASGGTGGVGAIDLADAMGTVLAQGVTQIQFTGGAVPTEVAPGIGAIAVPAALRTYGGGVSEQTPSRLDFGTGFQCSWDPATGFLTVTSSVGAIMHDPVAAVLLEQPAPAVSYGRLMPTDEQADGIDVAAAGSSARFLIPDGTDPVSGTRYTIWRVLGGTRLYQVATETIADGHLIPVSSGGRVYGGRLFRAQRHEDVNALTWVCDGGPRYAANRLVAASGAQEWVPLITWTGPDQANHVRVFDVYAVRYNDTQGGFLREWTLRSVYVGRDWSGGFDPCIPTSGTEITFVEGAETEVDARLRIVRTNNDFTVECLRSAAGGDSYRYRVEANVTVHNV
jgi:hypothetical protein